MWSGSHSGVVFKGSIWRFGGKREGFPSFVNEIIMEDMTYSKTASAAVDERSHAISLVPPSFSPCYINIRWIPRGMKT